MQLLQQAAPRAKAIVSGSYAHGTATAKSDLDFLVVEPGPIARRLESAHPRAILGLIGIPVNIVVIAGDIFEEWLSTPGMIALDPACPARPYRILLRISDRVCGACSASTSPYSAVTRIVRLAVSTGEPAPTGARFSLRRCAGSMAL
jgi:hypothetical protein